MMAQEEWRTILAFTKGCGGQVSGQALVAFVISYCLIAVAERGEGTRASLVPGDGPKVA